MRDVQLSALAANEQAGRAMALTAPAPARPRARLATPPRRGGAWRRLWLVAPAVAALSGCRPSVKSFVVQPQAYCSTTEKIHVAWSTSHGDTTLQIEPPETAPRKVPPGGRIPIAPPRPMTVTLTVADSRTHESRRIEVRPVDKHPLNGLTRSCADGWVTTEPFTFGGGPNAFDPDARVSILVNRCAPDADAFATCRRKIEVRHGAHTWSLGPDSALDVSASNAQVAGEWVLKGQLLPGEVCGTPSAETAQELALSIEMGCKGE